MQARIATIELDPEQLVQSFPAYPGWGMVQSSARFDAIDQKVLFYVGYVWEPANGDSSPFDSEPVHYPVYLYPADVDFEFDPTAQTIGIVKLGDGTYRLMMISYTALPPEEPPTDGQ
jgi:hypothetical protein